MPIVDDTSKLSGAACTLFQRMDEKGDMLRIATSVVGKDGNRAVGTYIPSVNADGSPNAVVATVLSGSTFQGRAFVVDSWYISAYEPIRDEKGSVIGMLFVGVKQENLRGLLSSIQAIKIGKTGYAYVLQGSGAARGTYIISEDGKRDGENIWDQKDPNGRLFVQDIVKEALSTQDGNAAFVTYPWKNPEDPAPRMKMAAVTYYAPWDWVIGVGAYKDEIAAETKDATDAVGQLVWITLAAGLLVTLCASVVALVLGRGIARPINAMVDAARQMAEGDLSQMVAAKRRDEMGELGKAFNHMTHPAEYDVPPGAHLLRPGGLLQRGDHRQRADAGGRGAEPGVDAGGNQRVRGGADRVRGPGERARPEPGRRRGAGRPLHGAGAEVHRGGLAEPRARSPGLPTGPWRTRRKGPGR